MIAVQQKRPLYFSKDDIVLDITDMLVIIITSIHQDLALYSRSRLANRVHGMHSKRILHTYAPRKM